MFPVKNISNSNIRTLRTIYKYNGCCIFRSASSVGTPNNVKGNKDKKVKANPSTRYQQTLFLPRSSIPTLSSKKVEEEATVQQQISWQELYSWQRGQEQERPKEFVLHDGPPYANGQVHMGHALNKILKDITLRQKLLQGYRVHYIPGWDCHGLPIELMAIKDSDNSQKDKQDAVGIRSKAREFAEKCLAEQKKSFLKWGVMGDWNNAYTTHSTEFVIKQLQLFTRLYEKDLIFQRNMPVYYSPSSRTTLAESELEYNDKHQSISIIVAFKTATLSQSLKDVLSTASMSTLYLPIFTTTPWSMPFNRAVCYNESLKYALVKAQHPHHGTIALIWAQQLLPQLKDIMPEYTLICSLPGSSLAGIKYHHPLSGTLCPMLPASHVKEDLGTGLVHTAPAHGKEDYMVALEHNLPMESDITDEGCFGSDGVHTDLTGLSVLGDGNTKVIELIESQSMSAGGSLLLSRAPITHSYPYDWRTGKPVILRASSQWFIYLQELQDKTLSSLKHISTHPHGKYDKELRNTMTRPHWCISRQRVWGTPLPVFYDREDGTPVFNATIAQHIIKVLETHGCDAWWTMSEEQLLPPSLKEQYEQQGKPLPVKATDVLDVWFDSGCTFNVLEGRSADLIIEGYDQFRGWFQSSLLLSIAFNGQPSYRNIYCHGFVVDKELMKMSKSKGNVVSPEVVFKKKGKTPAVGADVLRLWAASVSADTHARCSVDLLRGEHAANLHRIRLTLKFLAGCVKDYTSDYSPSYDSLPLMEQYALHRLHRFDTLVWDFYNQYNYHDVCSHTVDYFSNELSKEYFTCIKHRLYCSGKERQAIQYVLHHILQRTLYALTPVIPHFTQFLADHTYPGQIIQREIRTAPPAEWQNEALEAVVSPALELRKLFNAKFRSLDSDHSLKLSNMNCSVSTTGQKYSALKMLQPEECSTDSPICELLEVASVTISDSGNEEYTIEVEESNCRQCERCRKYRVSHELNLCTECQDIVDKYASNS